MGYLQMNHWIFITCIVFALYPYLGKGDMDMDGSTTSMHHMGGHSMETTKSMHHGHHGDMSTDETPHSDHNAGVTHNHQGNTDGDDIHAGHTDGGHNHAGHTDGGNNHAGHTDGGNNHADHTGGGHNHAGHTGGPREHDNHGGALGHSFSFFFSDEVVILFTGWVTDNTTFIPSCAGVALIAVFYEGFKAFREYLLRKAMTRRKEDHKCCTSMCACMHVLQMFLHMIQVAISYGLMLIFMTFNVWLCVSVLIGAGVGYLMFAWTSHSTYAVSSTDHCM